MSSTWRAATALALAALSLPLTGCIQRVSVNSDAEPANSASFAPSISADGNVVAFQTQATNLSPNDTSDTDVFVRDRAAGTTTLASRSQTPTEGNFEPAMSADARYVAFSSGSPTIVAGDTNQRTDVFVFDRTQATTTRVSVSSSEAQANDGSGASVVLGLSVSGDGRYVAFPSIATNLVAGDTNGLQDIFIRDTVQGTTIRVPAEVTGEQSRPESGFFGLAQPVLSRDGSVVVFTSVRGQRTSSGGEALSAETDVYLYRLAGGTTTRLSNGATRGQARRDVSVTSDGRLVAFTSVASDLVPGDTNGVEDVFVRNTSTTATTRFSAGATPDPDDTLVGSPSIDGAGRVVAFLSSRTGFNSEVWVRYLAEGVTKPVTYDGTVHDGYVQVPRMSASGKHVAFSSSREDLIPIDGNGLEDVFVADTPPLEDG